MAAIDIVTFDEAQRILGTDAGQWDAVDTAEATDIVTAVSARLDQIIGATMARTVVAELDGGVRHLRLPMWPILTVTSVIEWDGTTQRTLTAENRAAPAADNYLLRSAKWGVLTRRRTGSSGYWACGDANVIVTYQAGRTSADRDLQRIKRAAAICVRHVWEQERTIGSTGVGETPPRSFSIPKRALELVADLIRPEGTA